MKGPSRLTARTRCHSSRLVSRIGLKTATPALLTSATTRPRSASTFAAAARTWAMSATSHAIGSTHPRSASAARSTPVASMSSMATA